MLKLTAINYTSHDALVIALHPTVCVQSIFTHNDAFSLNQLALIGSNYVNTHAHTHMHAHKHLLGPLSPARSQPLHPESSF